MARPDKARRPARRIIFDSTSRSSAVAAAKRRAALSGRTYVLVTPMRGFAVVGFPPPFRQPHIIVEASGRVTRVGLLPSRAASI